VGMFDKFKSYRETQNKKSAEKFGETLKRKLTTKEQRLEAIEALEGMPPEISLPHLIKRYELVVESGIQDMREKEIVEEAFLRHKDAARPVVIEALKSMRRVSWPVRIAEKLFPREEYIGLLYGALNLDDALFDESVQERNCEILLALKDIDDPGVVEKATKLVRSRDEGVRMAAIECLEAHAAQSEHAKVTLLELLKEAPTDSNSRLLGIVRSVAQRHNWV
jgi:hypothetical protein